MTFKKYYLFSVISTLLVSFYPLYMGVIVIAGMVRDGVVHGENYPKYIIPYTPISLAVITGVLLLPAMMKYAKKFALPVGSALSVGVFFLSEFLFESKVIVMTTMKTTLESWQMYMCYVPPESYESRPWCAVDVLIGDYSPAFKIHFYVIALVIILTLLNCFYGFANIIRSEDKSRLKVLILQLTLAIVFLGLCVFACFTAFFREGDIIVSPLSATLMSVFFIVFGLTMGIYVGSFLLGKNNMVSVVIPAIVSAIITMVMYFGEMILLSGHLYRFGTGFFFDGFESITFALVDILIIILSGVICALICLYIRKELS